MSNNKFTDTTPNYAQLHQEVPQMPIDFSSMVLTDQYALTVVCMIKNYTLCVHLADKSADEVINAYLREICCRFGGSRKLFIRQWK